MTHSFDISDRGRWYVKDWAGNVMLDGQTYDDFESAADAISEHCNQLLANGVITEEDYDAEHEEYHCCACDADIERERHEACRRYKIELLEARDELGGAAYQAASLAQDKARGYGPSFTLHDCRPHPWRCTCGACPGRDVEYDVPDDVIDNMFGNGKGLNDAPKSKDDHAVIKSVLADWFKGGE